MTDIDTKYNIVRREFYRLWNLARIASKQARTATREGREEEARGALVAFRVLSRQAKEAYIVLESMREQRPTVGDMPRVAP